MRSAALVVWILLGTCASAVAQVSVGIRVPGVSIGIDLGRYPDLVPVSGYPVYYAPQLDSNFFFYDGFYWVYAQDRWYVSSWYNGPWDAVSPEWVPLFVLRVPVRYYRRPPGYFRGWRPDAPPRWGEHWGRDWEQRHGAWDKWDRASVPAPAPLPTYQREYSRDRYPRFDQQQVLRNQHYKYQPRETVVRQQHQNAPAQPAPMQRPAQSERDSRNTPPPGGAARGSARPPQVERGTPPQQGRPGADDRNRRGESGSPPAHAQDKKDKDKERKNTPSQDPKRDPDRDHDR